MQIDRTVLFAVAGVALGFVIGYAVSSSGRSALEAQLRQNSEVAAAMNALESRIDGIEGSLRQSVADIQARVDEIGSSDAEGRIAALAERVEGMGSDIGARLEGMAPELRATVSSEIAALQGRLAALSQQATAVVERAIGEGPATGAGTEVRVGGTALLADGALRVFLSGLNAEAGTARVAVNGQSLATLALGETTEAGDCSVTLTGLGTGSATVDGSCGGSATEEAAAPVQGSGEGTEVRVGATALLADGALRVFLAAFDEAAGTARVAVNGTALTALTMAQPVEVGDCTVELTGGSGRSAIIDGGC
jgi:hypothetical protein